MSLVNTTFPPLPTTFEGMRGSPLPNNNLLVSGGYIKTIDQEIRDLVSTFSCQPRRQMEVFPKKCIPDTYLLYNHASKQWKEVGKMKMARCNHSSVLLNGFVFSCGGDRSYRLSVSSCYGIPPDKPQKISSHEVFSLDGIVKERKELPIALSYHTANKINETQYMICGGYGAKVSKTSCKS